HEGVGTLAWIVGGAVRDALLGLPVPEIDVAVSGDAESLARELEREGFGRAVFISRDRPGPRVFRVAGKDPLDIAEIEGGTIEADLQRRDFTVNALAAALDSGELLDPFGGRKDLARGRLRCVHPRNLLEDPLRVLRAARLMATRNLTPDRATLAASRRAAPRFRRVAPERVAAELWKLLGAASAQPAMSWARRAGILPAALRLKLSKGKAARAVRSLSVLEHRAIRALEPQQRRRLRLARLAAGLSLSPRKTRRWLRDLRAPRRDVDEVSRLRLLADSARRVKDRRDAWQWILEAGDLAPEALRLLALGSPRLKPLASRLRRMTRLPRARVPVTGDDVVRWVGIAPGPQVGALLAQLRLAAAMGTVRNRREARNWLTGQVPNAPHRL
ncbi:MAG: hypothetical protein ABI968_07735, partial [Acidobacteriota bacterium]